MRSTSDTSLKLTVPNGLPVGCRIDIIQAGKGTVMIGGNGTMRSERLHGQAAVQTTQGRFAEASLLIDSRSSFLVGGQVSDGGDTALADAGDTSSPGVSLASWHPGSDRR